MEPIVANNKKFVVKNGLQTQNISFVDSASGLNEITAAMDNTGTLSLSGDITVNNVTVEGTGRFSSTGAIIIPVGTTGQRPASAVVGMMRFNTTLSTFEGYNGVSWVDLSEAAFEGDLNTQCGIVDLMEDTGTFDLMAGDCPIEGDLSSQSGTVDLNFGTGTIDLSN